MDAASFALIFFIAAIGFLVWIMRNLGKPQQHEIRTEQRHTQTVTYDHMRDPLGVGEAHTRIEVGTTQADLNRALTQQALSQREELDARAALLQLELEQRIINGRTLPPPVAREVGLTALERARRQIGGGQ